MSQWASNHNKCSSTTSQAEQGITKRHLEYIHLPPGESVGVPLSGVWWFIKGKNNPQRRGTSQGSPRVVTAPVVGPRMVMAFVPSLLPGMVKNSHRTKPRWGFWDSRSGTEI